jgi:dTDP-glucose 4,6-dehydratase
MRVLVTGGLGAVGSVLVGELRGRGHEVWVSDLVNSGGPNYVRCDVSHYRQVQRIFEQQSFDYVYHLAAEFGRWNGEDFYENLWMTNAMGTKNITRMQEQYGFRLIAFSSSEVYGDYDGVMYESVMDEIPIKQMNDYAMTKWVNEMQVLNSAEMFGTESVRVRLFNTYGPGEYYSPYRSALCLFMYRALHDIPYTVYRGHHRTSTYVTDTARTLANIPENFIPGEVYNIGGLEYHDMEEASNLILGYLGKDDSLVTYKQGEPHTTRVKKVDVSKAVRDLGHDPQVPLEEGVPLAIEWMKSVYGKEASWQPS